MLERIVRGEDFLQIADAASDQDFCTSAYSREVIEVTGARTTLIISLRKDTTLLVARAAEPGTFFFIDVVIDQLLQFSQLCHPGILNLAC
jgi:hypothetical protein